MNLPDETKIALTLVGLMLVVCVLLWLALILIVAPS